MTEQTKIPRDDFDKKLDEIADESAKGIRFGSVVPDPKKRIKSAMLAAIELYAQREPSKATLEAGAKNGGKYHYPAMQAAQLKEIKEVGNGS